MLNVYSTEFFSRCPVNAVRIKYSLRIETAQTIAVEAILDRIAMFREGFHEAFADALFKDFGGIQTLTADHHGVTIVTTRAQAPTEIPT